MWSNQYQFDVKGRILAHSKSTPTGCIEYRKDVPLKHKYGLISITINSIRKSVPAHRALWMAVNNQFDIPRNFVIRHTCDNPRCVNIDHLIGGTHKDNCDDKISRGRNAKNYKLHTRQCRLSNEQILVIRNGKEKPSYYCWKYKITPGYVSKLKNGKAKTLIT